MNQKPCKVTKITILLLENAVPEANSIFVPRSIELYPEFSVPYENLDLKADTF